MASNQHSQRERTPDRNTQPPPPKMGRYFLESESEEDLEAVPLPPKKKARRSMATIPLSPESEKEEETEPPNAVLGVMGFSMPPVRIMHHADGSQSFQKMEGRQVRILKTAAQNMEGKEQKGVVIVRNPTSEPLISAWEKGMEAMAMLMEKYHVDHDERASFRFLPDQGAVYKKICTTWLNEEKRGLQLTFSSQKTFQELMGRFLQGYMQAYAGVQQNTWEPTGCCVWEHQCTEREGELRCLHGMEMVRKEHLIEMDVTSESGQRALKENPSKAKVVQNRWGRNVVQIKNDDARCCFNDVGCGNNSFSGKSCGLFYSEGTKAQMAFRQIEAFMLADYPHMRQGQKRFLMPVRCECLNKQDGLPRMGRQLCKITPFNLSNVENIDVNEVTDPGALASIKYPCLLVFQCANPVYRNARGNAGPNCDFKISAPDVMGALQLVRQLWGENFEGPLPRLVIPEFKWHPRLQYRNIALPTNHGDSREEPFDF